MEKRVLTCELEAIPPDPGIFKCFVLETFQHVPVTELESGAGTMHSASSLTCLDSVGLAAYRL